MKTPKILVVTPMGNDANSFWRCMGPMSYLDSVGGVEVHMKGPNQAIGWPELIQYDLLFLHRPCRDDDIILMQIAYNLNIPVWIDYDDWLFTIPSWNPTSKIYNSHAIQMKMAQCLACADVVSVTTPELYNYYKRVNPNVVIVPNAYRSDVFPYREKELPPRQDYAMWRGSNTHAGDVLSVKVGFQQIAQKIVFVGDPGWELEACLPKNQHEFRGGIADVMLYFKAIYDWAPKVLIFPLFDCLFNRCKSNIAYIEALHAGALCVAPDLPEWNREGVVTYQPNNSDSFVEAVNQCFEMPEEQRQETVRSAFFTMKQSCGIAAINDIREQIVEILMSKTIEKKNPFDNNLGLRALMALQGALNSAKSDDVEPTH